VIADGSADAKPKLSATTLKVARAVFAACKTQPVRSMTEFAAAEMILPYDGGPFEGERLRWETQPFSRLLYEQFDDPRWQEIMVTGPSQSGKTFLCFVTPIVYVAAELRKNMVVAVPDMAMADDKWRIDIKPVFAASPKLSQLLPTSGPGSKDGTVKNTITLTNGVIIKFMSPFGDDANRAGFTAPYVIVTEAARFSNPSERSVEADPLRQLKARQRSVSRFDADGNLATGRRMLVEGTVTLEDELPWKARIGSTMSRIVCPCPHCGDWVSPDREHLVGWQDATSELEAAEKAFFVCPTCSEEITESQRREMNVGAKLLHDGQSIVGGEVVGDPPRTMRLFFRWSAFNNLFVATRDLGVEEWNADQHPEGTMERTNAEKDLCQSIWCTPYVPPRLDLLPLKRDAVAKRHDRWPMGMIPADAKYVAAGVDVGRWRCWFFVLVAREAGQLPCVFYGSRDTTLAQGDEKTPHREAQAIAACLTEIADLLDAGFVQEGTGARVRPDISLVDSNYFPNTVIAWAKQRTDEAGPDEARWLPVLGNGQSRFGGRAFTQPTKLGNVVRRIGDGWYLSYEPGRNAWRVVVDADRGKLDVQDALRVDPSRPGALVLPFAQPKEHSRVSAHLASEVFTEKDGKRVWNQSGQNHLLDCAAYAYNGLKFLGWSMPEIARDEMVVDAIDVGAVAGGDVASDSEVAVAVAPKKSGGWLAAKGIRL